MTSIANLDEFMDVPWWPRDREARVTEGPGGHEKELVLNIDGYDHNEFIPEDVVDVLRNLLPPTWYVESRGTRIEIHPSGVFAGGFTPVKDKALIEIALARMGLRVSV